MKTSALLWLLAAIFYAVIAIVYRSLGGDTAGTTLLIAACAFGGLVAGWSWRSVQTTPPGVDDSDDADVIDGVGEMGVYPTSSLRPLGVAAGMAIMLTGVALGSWMVAVGATILASQAALIVRDADR